MNTKQLAEMVKRLRKDKLDALATTDMNTTGMTKGATRDIVEYSVMAGPTSSQITKTLRARTSAIDTGNQPKGGNDMRARYTPRVAAEEAEEKVSKKSKAKTLINTSPEQESSMIGTQ